MMFLGSKMAQDSSKYLIAHKYFSSPSHFLNGDILPKVESDLWYIFTVHDLC